MPCTRRPIAASAGQHARREPPPVPADHGGNRSGWGFVFGSTRALRCVYAAGKRTEHYAGDVSKFGVDIGYLQSGVLIWGVLAPTTDLGAGALAGEYGGVTAGAAIGVGANANLLIGGSNKSISLQPLSVEGDKGINVAAGIAAISLKVQP